MAKGAIRWPALGVGIVGAHAIAASFAWHFLAGGFAPAHPRFWANEVLPIAVIVVGLAFVLALCRRALGVATAAWTFIAALDAGMAPAWKLVFPITGSRPAMMASVLAMVVLAGTWLSLRRAPRTPMAIAGVLGLAVGVAIPWTQRGRDPATHPAALQDLGHSDGSAPAPLPTWIELAPARAALRLHTAAEIDLEPLLTFESRSPDRGWTPFADRTAPPRRFIGASRDAYFYDDAMLRVSGDEATLHVDARTVVPAAVYAHLDAFTAIRIRGHHHLFIAFSPAPNQKIEVTYAEYPTGRPSRLAYLTSGELHVVEATSGEKGPFHELARGAISGPLGMTLFDDDQPIADLVFADFTAQASTELSPTAGWGVPQNAIEFSLTADHLDAPISIFLALAATSVGRGWDSVGHAPGTYRNRIEIRRR